MHRIVLRVDDVSYSLLWMPHPKINQNCNFAPSWIKRLPVELTMLPNDPVPNTAEPDVPGVVAPGLLKFV